MRRAIAACLLNGLLELRRAYVFRFALDYRERALPLKIMEHHEVRRIMWRPIGDDYFDADLLGIILIPIDQLSVVIGADLFLRVAPPFAAIRRHIADALAADLTLQ